MPKVPWLAFRNDHPSAHLVAASVPTATLVGSTDLKIAQADLGRFIKKLAPAGDYATSIVREAGRPEVYLAFADEADARKLADALQAKATRRYAGWASQRAFHLDAATLSAMNAGLPLPRKRQPAKG